MKQQYQYLSMAARFRALTSLKFFSAILLASLCVFGLSANAQTLEHYYYTAGGASITNDQVGGTAYNGTFYGYAATNTPGTNVLITDGNGGGLTNGVIPAEGMKLPGSTVANLTNAWTIIVWFQAAGNSYQSWLYGLSDGTTGNLMASLAVDGGSPYPPHIYFGQSGFTDFYGNGFNNGVGGSWTDDGALHQEVAVYDGSNFRFYVDSQTAASGALSCTNIYKCTNVVVAGGSPWASGDRSFNGPTYSFAIIRGAVSPLKISAVYAAGKDATPAALATAIAPPTANSVVWNGLSGSGNNWSDTANWVSGNAPWTTNTDVKFAGTTRLTPAMDNNYNLLSLTYSNNAGAFTINNGASYTLTLSGNVTNNSVNAQTFSVPVSLAAESSWFGGSTNFNLNNPLSGSGGLIFIGSGALKLPTTGSSTLGGQLGLEGGYVVVPGGSLSVTGNVTAGYAFAGAPTVGSSWLVISNGASVNVGNADNNSGYLQAGIGGGTNEVSGTVTVTNATLTARADSFIRNGGAGAGTFNIMNMGVFNVGYTNVKWLRVGANGDYNNRFEGYATLNIASGATVNANSDSAIQMGDGWDSGTNTININGNLHFYGGNMTGAGTNGYLNLATGYGSARNTVNLNSGGTLTVATVANWYQNGTRIFNFNGGTLVSAYNGVFDIGSDANAIATVSAPTIIDTAGYNLAVKTPLKGSATLTKNGAGTLTLSASNALTCPLAVNVGGLLIDEAAAGGSVTISNLTLASGTGLQVSVKPGAVVNAGAVTIGGPLTLRVFGNITGTFTLLTSTSHSGGTFPMTVLGPQGFAGTANWSGNNLVVTVTSPSATLVWDGTFDAGYWDLTDPDWMTNSVTGLYYTEPVAGLPGDSVRFDDSSLNPNPVIDTIVRPSSVVISNTLAVGDYDIDNNGGHISGSTGVTKQGDGTVYFTTAAADSAFYNDYSGNTVVSQGKMVIPGTGKDGAFPGGSGKGDLVVNGTFDLNGDGSSSYNNLTGTGNVTNGLGNNAIACRFFAYNTRNTEFDGRMSGQPHGVGSRLSLHRQGGVPGTTLALNLVGTNYLENLTLEVGTVNFKGGTVIFDTGAAYTHVSGSGNLEVSGGEVDIAAASGAGAYFGISTGGGTTNTVLVDGGTLAVTNNNGTSVGISGGYGILTITSGKFVNNVPGGYGLIVGDGGATAGVVNLNGGSLEADVIRSLSGTSQFNFNGGTLKSVGTIGGFAAFWENSPTLTANILSGGAKIDTTAASATIAQPLVGSGALTKLGTGTLTLSGTNTYTGNTTVSNGVLSLAQPIPVLANGSTVSVGPGVLNLADGTVTNQVTALKTNGVAVANGLYHAGVDLTSFLSGTGYIKVGPAGPTGPTTLTNVYNSATHVLSLSWAGGLGWRLQAQLTNNLAKGLSTNWVYLTDGTINSTNISVDTNRPTAFYRLTYP